MPNSQQSESPELASRASFIDKFLLKYGDNKVSFYDDSLQSAVDKVQNIKLTTNKRILILLYLHNDFDHFSNECCNLLLSKEWADIPAEKYLLVVWDITEDRTSQSLKSVAKKFFGYNVIYNKLTKQQPSLLTISPSLTILESIDNTTSLRHFPFNFKYRLNILSNLQSKSQTEDDDHDDEICSQRFQQLMYEYLGNRDFDSFEYDEHDYLKQKIFFAIYGMPDSTEDDTEKRKIVDDTYNQIRATNNRYCKWDDKVVLSFIYNCTESTRNITSRIHPLPIFIVRKCKGDRNACRLFIDLDLRVYDDWENYLRKNLLPRCRMVVPQNGRYRADSSGNVLLETHRSPRCSKSAEVLKYFDILVTILALISAFAMIGGLMFPFLALPAGIVGLLCAIYSITRSSMQIHDRRIHKQDMNVRNPDARGAYLNILGNSIGIIGGGLTRTVAIIATKGIKIGKAVITTVNAFNYAGITTDFAGILNALHEIQGSKRLDALQVLQFTFSVLFFNNSVVNLVNTKGQLIQSEISQSMKTNLVNRPIHKTTGQTITHLRNIHSNDIMKILSTSNADASKSKAIKELNFSTHNGRVTLNNISVSIMRQTVVKFQGMYMPPTAHITKIIQAKFLTDEENVELYIDILHRFPDEIKNLIIDLAKRLLQMLKEECLNFRDTIKKIFPHSTYAVKILEVIVLYFEEKYNMECQTNESEEDKRESLFKWIENYYGSSSTILVDLIQFYLDWITTAIYEYERARLNREKRRQVQEKFKIKVYCKKCGGHYYKYSKKNIITVYPST